LKDVLNAIEDVRNDLKAYSQRYNVFLVGRDEGENDFGGFACLWLAFSEVVYVGLQVFAD
jgi:hypothetical protein